MAEFEEIAELKTVNDERALSIIRLSEESRRKDARIAELEAELMEAREDSKRLDFLLARRNRFPVESTNGWIVQEYNGHTTGRGSSPRAAIDAARKKESV